MSRTRILVVDDSITVRKHIVEILSSDPQLEVVGEAEDGKRAIELCQALRPDVVTLDMILPLMSGVAVTEYVMAHCPTPILVVSASLNRGELHKTYDALAAGAVDVLEKPTELDPDQLWAQALISAVRMVSRIKVITHLRGKLGLSTYAAEPETFLPSAQRSTRIIALGTSTGGPGAVQQILRALPANFPIPILLVIHIGEPFGLVLADWLDGQSALPVRYAKHRERLPELGQPGVLMAPPESHLVVQRGRLHLTQDLPKHSCRPSVDVLFSSLAAEVGAVTVACLMTGMGRDGAEGLLALRRAGARTIAQDEASSVIFGMPREAILLGAAERVLPLRNIAAALVAEAQPSKSP